ncbi:Protein DEHYDRATION-INDUCED 19 homolog 5 [Linum perenne]
MEDDKWSIGRLSSASSRSYQQQDHKFLSDLCIDFEEDADDYLMADYPCPYCEEDFDLVELCCHIDDEHPYEPSSEMCPVCGLTVTMDMVGHITSQHGDMFKSLQKLKRRKGDSRSSLKKEEAEDDYWSSLFSRFSAPVFAPTNDDPLLSFIQNMPSLDKDENSEPLLETRLDAAMEQSEDKQQSASAVTAPPLSDKELTEKTNRSQFVQGLLLSTIFNDDL